MIRRPLSTGYIDLLSSTLLLLFLYVHPPSAKSATQPVWDYTLRVVWTEGNTTDVDTYVRLPDSKTVWFRQLNVGTVWLDRDDTGQKTGHSPLNEEVVQFAKPDDGIYDISIHDYNDFQPGRVTLDLSSRYGDVCDVTVDIPPLKQELPIFRVMVTNSAVTCEPGTFRVRKWLASKGVN